MINCKLDDSMGNPKNFIFYQEFSAVGVPRTCVPDAPKVGRRTSCPRVQGHTKGPPD